MQVLFRYVFVFMFIFSLGAKESSERKTICLNMIVRNEAPVIERCLGSVKDLIDYWVIVDTGSTDGTQDKIRKFMKGVPGELHEKPWVNFGHNRHEALKLAEKKADYVMFIDADEQLVFQEDFKLPNLVKDVYLATVIVPNHTFSRTLLVKSDLNWSWNGVMHEELKTPKENITYEVLSGMQNLANTYDGHRSQDPKKHEKDAAVLEKALEQDPNNSRYTYYLAQEYAHMGRYDLALKTYQKRATMGGWDQEVFTSLFMVARLQQALQMPSEVFIDSYCKAYQFRPTRAEPLFHMAVHYLNTERPVLGYALAKHALQLPMHNDIVFREDEIFEYALLGLFGDCAHQLGFIAEAKEAYALAISAQTAPNEFKKLAQSRLDFYQQLEEKAQR